MNDNNDINDQQRDVIGNGIVAAAGGIDAGDADAMLIAVRGVATARRRRRSAALGVAAVGTLAVSGVLLANVVNDNGSEDLILSADSVPQSTEAPVDTEVAPPATVPVVPPIVPGAPGQPIAVQVVPAMSISTSDPAVVSESSYMNAPQLFAWQDGFLAIRRDSDPQPLPAELPQEIIDQFPPEVIDLFPDGLPPTIDEAIAQLSAAGLLDEVTAIVSANADVSEAIYSTPSEVRVSVRFSTDGVEWSDIDADFPAELANSYNLYVAGDRLVIVSDGRDFDLGGPVAAEDAEITVISSADLVNWTRQVVPLPARAADVPEFMRVETYPESLVGNAERWVMRLSTYSDLDLVSLLSDDLQDRLRNGSGGYGTSTDKEGVTIEIYDVESFEPGVDESVDTVDTVDTVATFEPEEPSERVRFTWSELGLDGEPENLNEQSTVTWTSNWVDVPVIAADAVDGDLGWNRTVAIEGGFVTADQQSVFFSADGLTWSSADLSVEGFIDSLMPVDNGVVAFVNESDGTASQHQLDVSTMTWTPIAIDGLPESFSVERTVNGAATLYEQDMAGFGAGPMTQVGTAEVDGYRVELSTTFSFEEGEASYTVTDIATGEVVSTETSSDIMNDNSPFEFADESYEIEGEEGITFLDPATGEELVEVPFEAMTYVQLGADGEVIPEQDFSDSEPSIPSRWMLATNGSSWIVEQVSEASTGDTEEAYFEAEIGDIAVNGDTVLIAKFDGTFLRYDLG